MMNELGVIVHFHEPPALADLVILDPQWLTHLMSTLVTTKQNFVKQGILHSNDFGQIWKAPEFPEYTHGILSSLLQKFEITFPLPLKKNETNNRYLVPYLIHGDRPQSVTELFLTNEKTQ